MEISKSEVIKSNWMLYPHLFQVLIPPNNVCLVIFGLKIGSPYRRDLNEAFPGGSDGKESTCDSGD